MKIVVLDAGTLGPDTCMKPLEEAGELVVLQDTLPEQIEERIKDADVVITNKRNLNEDNLTNAENLKLICVTATGYDKIDTKYCKKKGIALCNVPGYSTDSVVQVTLSIVLSLSTKLRQYSDYVASGDYSRGKFGNFLEYKWNELPGKTWGIVGGGAIGQKVAQFAKLLGCKVLMFRRKKDEVFENAGIDRVCKESDVITVHLPLTDDTRNIISKERIAMMKKNVILVNTSRGAVTDESAIAEALEKNQIGAFGADVYSTEPFPENHPFGKICKKENVILTPHMAWSAVEARDRCIYEVAENIKAFFAGEKRNRVV